jgi:UDP-N-acetyl-D-galactosamine dehydrogenase
MTEKIAPLSDATRIAVIGLGYVGLPLAAAFAAKFPVTGFDIDPSRITNLRKGMDQTLQVDEPALKSVIVDNPAARGLFFSSNIDDIRSCQIYIVTVPTPADKNNRPDLSLLFRASEMTAGVLKPGDLVIYESTVYPGVTEEECVPILERVSNLKYNRDFFVGYSPERINPGDKVRTVTNILKVTSGSTPEVADYVDVLYRRIVTAGTHKASSIKVAEAAKVIENSQRDINIAFVNELSKIFNRMGIDTHDVLEAAGTKWNFLKFYPGLVGGHCIGVDPYYLAQKAQELGYHPEIILAGRRLNDDMSNYIAGEVIKLMIKNDIQVKAAKILILGFTFKENCPDVRNTKVIDIIKELESYNTNVTVYDPWAKPEEVLAEYGVHSYNDFEAIGGAKFDTIILAVGHEAFRKIKLKELKNGKCMVYDIKAFLDRDQVDYRL